MFLFLSRHRYGPLIQGGLGVVSVVAGLFAFTRILLSVGGLLIVLGIAGAITRLRRRNSDRHDASAEGTIRR